MRALFAGAVTLLLAACGGAGQTDTPPPDDPPPAPTLTAIEVAPGNASIAYDGTQAYIATGRYSDGSRAGLDDAVQWSSSLPSVATINTSGLASAAGAGDTEIRARLGDIAGVAFLHVNPPPLTGLSLRPDQAEVAAGLTQQFRAFAQYADGSSAAVADGVRWLSNNPDLATIDAAGLATGLAEGLATLRAEYQNRSASAQLRVTAPVLTEVIVLPDQASVPVGGQQRFAATANYSDGSWDDRTADATWSSADAAIASVDATGLATGVAPGDVAIRATLDGISGSATLSVSPLPPLPFKVGAAETSASFLPLGAICLGGYDTFCERNATAERDPLLAGGVAISGADEAGFILVKTTNVGYFAAYKAGNGPNGLYDIRQRIARRLNTLYGAPVVRADQIVVTADHSHQAPDTIGIWGGVPPAYMAILAQAAVDAGVEAWQNRVPARLYAGAVQGPPTAGSYDRPPTDAPDREFRVLFAEDRAGRRVATLMNYAPHATVLPSSNKTATGDWTAWAAQIVQARTGGIGLGLVGALGAMDWNKDGNASAREAEARQRLTAMLDAAFAARTEVAGDTVAVRTVFVREPLTQPILFANYAPNVTLPVVNSSVAIERAETQPWASGAAIGTYAAAVRLGDVFISTFPGEPFPQLHYALRDCTTLPPAASEADCGGITGTRMNFLLGAADDFLGYMLYTPEQYRQAFEEGALYLAGCPEEELRDGLGDDYDRACPDHWTLMVSPTIGRHLVCTAQNSAAALGFALGPVNDECPLLTAFDGIAAPAEYPGTELISASPAAALLDPAAGVVAQCQAQNAPAELCSGLSAVSQAVGDTLAGAGLTPPSGNPTAPSRAGVAVRDASWHLGASAGQFAGTGAGIARDQGFDPYGHSVRKVGSDTLGTRITVRALVVEDGSGNRIAVLSNDLYLPNDLLHRRVAQKLAEHDSLVRAGAIAGPVIGIGDANLATGSSHSHTSPFYSSPGWGTWIFQDVFDLRFYEYMATQMADAVIEAVDHLKPVRMGGATVAFDAIQSHTYGPKVSSIDGTPAGQPYDYTTQQLTVVRFDDVSDPADPQPLANWVIFGVHPEWVWGEEIINGDITHAVMRMLDRETGATTVWSQRETGASGPHKDTRVHPPEARREFQESAFAGYDRAARMLTDTVLKARADIENGTPELPSQFAPFATHFPVAFASQRVAPPATRPFPSVSNCNTDPVFGGRVGLPILGFPDCFYDHNDILAPAVEPLFAALPADPRNVRDQLIAAGVPVPTSYSASSFTAVEETAAVHLQVFKLGGIVATICPCEQFTSQALNIASRLDKIHGNFWDGFDWVCVAEARGLLPADEQYAQSCALQNARYPETGVAIPGSLEDAAAIAQIRAQIHNDAAGWELDPIYALAQQDPSAAQSLGGESEPTDPAAVKGNFTREEFTSHGYDLVIAVGMANDYWGYMPEYRDYRSFDHYRKALNGLGPHGADFLATRLSRLAANLNGAHAVLPYNPLDAVYQAESARAEATAQMIGETARAYTAAYEATLPADGGTPAIVQQPDGIVPRFSAAVVEFIGGSNYSDLPQVRVERCLDGSACDESDAAQWQTYGTQDGEVQLQLAFLPTLGSAPIPDNPVTDALDFDGAVAVPDPAALAQWRAGLYEWKWTASFEAFVSELTNLGARPGITPEGRYRFVVDGQHRGLSGVESYHLVSAPFTVVPWGGITVDALRVEADGRVSFAIGPRNEFRAFKRGAGEDDIVVPDGEPGYPVGPVDYPDSYEGGLAWIRKQRQLFTYGPGRDDDQQYCSRCTFRPWADSAQIASATVTVTHADGSTETVAAIADNGRWISSTALATGDSAQIQTGGIRDQYGEFNGAASASVSR